MSMWMALHIIRTQKAREELFESAVDYEQRFHGELRKEQLFAAYYRYAYTHAISEPNFVVTSDDPVIEFSVSRIFNPCVRVVAAEADFLLARREGKFEHELPMHDFFNAMMWGSPGETICIHIVPICEVDKLKEFARTYDLRGVIEDIQFEILGDADAL